MNYFSAPGIFKSEVTLDFILKSVCEILNISKEDAKSEKRNRPIVQAKKIFSYAARKYIKTATLREIGECVGKDHATVMHHIKDVKGKISIKDSTTIQSIAQVEGILDPIKWANIHAENITTQNNRYGRIQ